MTYFEVDSADPAILHPLPEATSLWTGAHLRGPAITTALARAAEGAIGPGVNLRPVRATFDLHAPVPFAAVRTEARIIKQGRTLVIVDAELLGEAGTALARCRVSFIADRAENAPPEPVWGADLPAECVPPPAALTEALAAEHTSPESGSTGHASKHNAGVLYRSSSTPWSNTRVGHQNADRNLVWCADTPVVAGEPSTPLQRAARVADLGNYVVNLGADGLAHINSDVTLVLARLPEPGGVGACSELRTEHGSVAVGTAHVFDRLGACGSVTVTAIRHEATRLDYTNPAS